MENTAYEMDCAEEMMIHGISEKRGGEQFRRARVPRDAGG
jgi:hypothetical protein